MSWFTRIFGHHEPPAADTEALQASPDAPAIPPERRGPDGEFDQSGLAKRVVMAFDQAGIEDAPHLYVAQHGSTIVFTGKVHEQSILDRVTEVARGVEGTTDVETEKVEVG